MCHTKGYSPVGYVTRPITKTQIKCNAFFNQNAAKYITKPKIKYDDF